MLDLPHHQSRVHPPMSNYNRAAQFSPFAALTGYEDVITETARLTDRQIELDENTRAQLDKKLQILMDALSASYRDHSNFSGEPAITRLPWARFVCFVPDARKEGGSYHTFEGYVRKINLSGREIVLHTGSLSETVIDMDRIFHIESDLFQQLEEQA